MATFKYTAKANSRERIEGTIEADSVKAAAMRLRMDGLFPVSIEGKPTGTGGLAILGRLGLKKVGIGVVAEFTEQFANLLEAGVPVERSLRLLEEQVSNAMLKQAIGEVAESVCRGKTLGQALSARPRIFSATYVSMVKVGEEAGLLADMLGKVAKSLQQQQQFRSRLKAAMVYPVFLACVGLATVIILMVWVIPKFSSFFGSLEHQLPLPTRFVIEASAVIAKVWPFVMIIAAAGALFALRALKNKKVKLRFDKLCLRMPVIGALIIKSQLAQLCRTLGTLLAHGITMLDALRIAGDTLSNKFIAEQVYNAETRVAKGEKLPKCFGQSRIFGTAVPGVMAVGQESGTLPQMLVRISEQYEQQTERQIKVLTNMIEPAILVVMGSVVGLVVVAMVMPIFKASAFVQ